MSMLQVLATTQASFEDAETGLAARVATLAETVDYDVSAVFTFGKWALREERMAPATAHRVVIRPAVGLDDVLQGQLLRDGVQQIAVLVEVFSADEEVIQQSLAVIQCAVLQLFDALRAYSDANDGTVIDIPDPISTRYGEFTGSATSGGLIATVNIRERSTQ